MRPEGLVVGVRVVRVRMVLMIDRIRLRLEPCQRVRWKCWAEVEW